MAWQPDYVSLAGMKDYLRIPSGETADTLDDTEIGVSITAASRAVDRACHRQFGNVGSTSTTRHYTAEWSRVRGAYIVDIDDIHDDAALVIESAGTPVTGYTLLPLDAELDARPYTRVVFAGSVSRAEGGIAVTTSKFGWASIPAAVVNATQIQASRLLKRRDSPFGVAGSPEMGNELRLLARLDPDVVVLLAGYERIWGAARPVAT